METWLRDFGLKMVRRDRGHVGGRMFEMQLPDKRKRGRPRRRFIGAVIEVLR